MLAIEAENLYKSYDSFAVLRGLTLRVPEGLVYGLLGPNGTGKSTLIHLLLGFLRPTRGVLRVFGEHDLELVRGRVGYLPERLRYHLRFTGREYLRFLGQFSDLGGQRLAERIDTELRAVGLLDAADRMLSTYSKGMLQRLGIAQALLADPALLLIDEPTSGLDPAGQREMMDLLGEVRSRGHTIFLATHFLDEIEHLCDRVGVLFDGRLGAEVDVQELRVPGRSALIRVADMPPDLIGHIQRLAPAVRCNGRDITLQPNSPILQAQVLRMLLDAEVPIIALEPQGRPLEELYLRVVRGEQLETNAAEEVVPPGMFAPPGHPDALPGGSDAPAAHPDASPVRPDRLRTGDTLLRELLGQEKQRGQPPDQEHES